LDNQFSNPKICVDRHSTDILRALASAHVHRFSHYSNKLLTV